MKLGPRKGDGAEVVIIELVTEPVAKKPASKVTKVEEAPKAEPVVEETVVEEAPAEEPAAEAEETPAE